MHIHAAGEYKGITAFNIVNIIFSNDNSTNSTSSPSSSFVNQFQ
jgi:hypothetical protein